MTVLFYVGKSKFSYNVVRTCNIIKQNGLKNKQFSKWILSLKDF